jgi:hypothetical protein
LFNCCLISIFAMEFAYTHRHKCQITFCCHKENEVS